MVGQTERINIRSIVIEDPQLNDGKFDPSQLDIVRNRFLRAFIKEFDEYKGYETPILNEADDALILLTKAFYLTSTFPETRKTLGLTDQDFEKWNKDVGTETYKIKHEAHFRSVFPNCNRGFDLSMLESTLQHYFNAGSWGAYDHFDLAAIELLDPGKGRELFKLARSEHIATHGEEPINAYYYTSIFDTADTAATLKILGINDEHIDETFWKYALNIINTPDVKDSWRMDQFLYHLKVLAAEKIHFGENGLELVMNEPEFKGPAQALPETRRF